MHMEYVSNEKLFSAFYYILHSNSCYKDCKYPCVLRNPIENIHKYPHFFEQPHRLESTLEFLATETWLYDSPAVIGEIYKEFIKYWYQQNLFIKNQMRVDGNIVDLKSVKASFLNAVAQKDDLVPMK